MGVDSYVRGWMTVHVGKLMLLRSWRLFIL